MKQTINKAHGYHRHDHHHHLDHTYPHTLTLTLTFTPITLKQEIMLANLVQGSFFLLSFFSFLVLHR